MVSTNGSVPDDSDDATTTGSRDRRRSIWQDLRKSARFVAFIETNKGGQAHVAIRASDGFAEGPAGEREIAGFLMKSVVHLFTRHQQRGGTAADFLPPGEEIPDFGSGTPSVPVPRLFLSVDDEEEPTAFALVAQELDPRGRPINSAEVAIPIDIYHNRELQALSDFLDGTAVANIHRHMGWPEESIRDQIAEIWPSIEDRWKS